MKDRWVLLIVSLMTVLSLACNLGPLVQRIFSGGEGLGNDPQVLIDEMADDAPVQDQAGNEPGPAQGCEPNWWSTDYWEINILPELSESPAHCWDYSAYFDCVQDRARAGDCPNQASAYCAPVYQEILAKSTSGAIQINDDSLYVRDDDNHFDLSFSMSGGSVSGSVLIDFTTEYGDGDACTITQQKTFSGTFDPQTCIMQGSVTVTETHQETRNDLCWGDPYQRNENWSMIVRNGRLGPGGPYNQLVGETYSLENYLK